MKREKNSGGETSAYEKRYHRRNQLANIGSDGSVTSGA